MSMGIFNDGWARDFPPVMRFVDRDFANDGDFPLSLLRSEPLYEAAKHHADKEAAASLVERFMSRDINVKQLSILKSKFKDAVIVPISAREGLSKNSIPLSLAAYISKQTNIKFIDTIVQTNRTHRSQGDAWHRLAFRPKFSGFVEKGRPHILVDDVFTYGGTLNELRLYIEKQGGSVVQMTAFTLGRHGNIIALQPKTRDILLYKYGEPVLYSFLQDKEINLYDGNYKNLTEPEACLIGDTQNLFRGGPEGLNAARNRIIEARNQGRSRLVQETLRTSQTSTITTKPAPPKPGGGRRF